MISKVSTSVVESVAHSISVKDNCLQLTFAVIRSDVYLPTNQIMEVSSLVLYGVYVC